MTQLLHFWLRLCLLEAAPQDMPASRAVLVVSVGGYALASVLLTTLASGFHEGVQMALLELVLLTLFTAGLLYLVRRPQRVGQTLAALTGSGALLGVPALALLLGAGRDSTALLTSIGWLVLLAWSLLVDAHILRHALSSSLAVGIGVALLYAMLTLLIISGLYPG